jgi:hypothetical protein
MGLSPTPTRIKRIHKAITAQNHGKVRLCSQAELEPRPFLNCRLYAFTQQLWFDGIRWNQGVDFPTYTRLIAETLRGATGRPEIGSDGTLYGTYADDLSRAVDKVFPWMSITNRYMPDTEMFAGLRDKKFTVSILVWQNLLPARQQRWAGSNRIGHVVSLMNARQRDGEWEVHYLDPMGRGTYRGDWVRYKDIRKAVSTYKSSTFVTVLNRGHSMSTLISPIQAWGSQTAKVVIPAGKTVSLYRLEQAPVDIVAVGTYSKGTRTVLAGDFTCEITRDPSQKSGVTGRFVRVSGGGSLDGAYIKTSSVNITVPSTPATSAEDLTKEYQRGRLEGEAALRDRLQQVDLPEELYTLTPEVR